MKRLTLIATISILIAGSFILGVRLATSEVPDRRASDEEPFSGAIAELRTLEGFMDPTAEGWIEGAVVGVGGSPGRFFTLSQYFFRFANSEDVERMVSDESAVVRAMGAVCFVAREETRAEWRLLDIEDDPAMLTVFALGCMGEKMTLGAFVRRLQTDAEFFSWFDPLERDANQLLQATPLSPSGRREAEASSDAPSDVPEQ